MPVAPAPLPSRVGVALRPAVLPSLWSRLEVALNHLTAARRGEDGWHYVSLNRRGGHPLGYCADHEPHPTEAEARECYARYQRDHVRLDIRSTSWHGCEADGCDNSTRTHAGIEGDPYHEAALCPEHLTVEHAIKTLYLDRPAGDSWQS